MSMVLLSAALRGRCLVQSFTSSNVVRRRTLAINAKGKLEEFTTFFVAVCCSYLTLCTQLQEKGAERNQRMHMRLPFDFQKRNFHKEPTPIYGNQNCKPFGRSIDCIKNYPSQPRMPERSALSYTMDPPTPMETCILDMP